MSVERSLKAVLFTDVVGSTERAAELGDRAWRELLGDHHSAVRRELRRFSGREANTAGDGFLATFDRPAPAIRCAWAIRETLRDLGLEVRSGIHAGEVQGSGRDLSGLGVHIGARVASLAAAGEILVTSTVRELVTGAGFRFEDRGSHALKGIPEEWRLFALKALPGGPAFRTGRWVPEFSRRQMGLAGVLTILVLLVAAGVLLVPRLRDRLEPDPAYASAAPGIAIVPFRVSGPDLEPWREGMVDLLSTSLDGAAGLRTIDSRTVLARWNETARAGTEPDLATTLEIARRAGGRYGVVGQAVAIGPAVRLTAQVYDLQENASLGETQVEGVPDSVFALVDQLTIEILEVIVPRAEELQQAPRLAGVTTTSLVALEAYLEGESLLRRSEFEEAIAAYERATQADSTFALAHWRIFQAGSWVAGIFSSRFDTGRLHTAYRFIDRLPRREATFLRSELAITEFRLDELEPLRAALLRHPDDSEGWFLLGETYYHIGHPALVTMEDTDRAFARAVQLEPEFTPYQIHRIHLAFDMGDTASAARLLGRFERLAPGADPVRQGRFALALVSGDSVARSRTLAVLDTLDVDFVAQIQEFLFNPQFGAEREAILLLVRNNGDADDEAFVMRRLVYSAFAQGQASKLVTHLADPRMPVGDRACGYYRAHAQGFPVPRELLEGALDVDGIDADTGAWAACLGAYAADRGWWEDHREAVVHLERRGAAALRAGDSSQSRSYAALAEALDAYATWRKGGKTEALRVLQSVQREADGLMNGTYLGGNLSLPRWWTGELLLELRRPADAEPYFRSMWFDPVAHERLAAIYERLDRRSEADAARALLASAWRGADPELRPRVGRPSQPPSNPARLSPSTR